MESGGVKLDPKPSPLRYKPKTPLQVLYIQRKETCIITYTNYELQEVLLTRSLDWALSQSHGTGCNLLKEKV